MVSIQKIFRKSGVLKPLIEKIKERINRLPVSLQHVLPFLTLTAVCCIIELLVNPLGEFPVHDDWVYAKTVLTLVTKGQYQLCPYQVATFFTLALWGALFAKLFGFSMTVLRFSVIFLAWIGSLVAYCLFRQVGGSRKSSLLAALTIATTPFYVLLANTFQTDVPFLVLTIASLIFLIRWIEKERWADLILGLLIVGAASLIRQMGFAIALSFSLAYLFKKAFRPKAFFVGIIATGTAAGALLLYHHWLQSIGQVPVLYTMKAQAMGYILKLLRGPQGSFFAWTFFRAFFIHLLQVLIYLGLFLSPFMLTQLREPWKGLSEKERWLGGCGALLYLVMAVTFLASTRSLMPLSTPMLYDWGLGDETSISGGLAFLPKAPKLFWLILTGVGLLGSGGLIFQILVAAKRIFRSLGNQEAMKEQWASVLCLSAFAIYYFPLGLAGNFDHYLLFYLPFILVGLIRNTARGPAVPLSRPWVPLGLVCILLIGSFSVAGTHDYLERLRTRWRVLGYMVHQAGISPAEIDGGYEFNGWNTYDPNYLKRSGMNWWWVIDDKYRISNAPLEGYTLLFKAPCKRWMPPGEGALFVLKRIAEKRPLDTGWRKTVYEF